MPMPLPPLTMPADLPPFLVANHSTQYGSPFGNVNMRTGHSRKRRLWTSVPQVFDVSLFLEREEMTAFHAWHRDSLRSGERYFSARVKEQGAGMLWFPAFFARMYEAEAMHFGRWRVAAQLILHGDGGIVGPALGAFAAEASIPFTGSGRLSVGKLFEAEASIDFLVYEES